MQIDLERHLNAFCISLKGKSHQPILKMIIIFFVVVALTFNTSGLMRPAAILLFFGMASQGPSSVLRRAGKFPPEIFCLNLWLLWSAITGIFVAERHDLFLSSLESVFLIVLLVNLVHLVVSYDARLVKFVMLAVLLSAIIHYIALRFGFVSEDEAYSGGNRAQGLANNPNTLGVRAVYSSIALLMTIPTLRLWKNLKGIFSLFLIFIVFTLILDSASRKAALSFVVLTFGFIALQVGNSRKRFNYIGLLAILPILIFALTAIIPYVIEDTVLSQRFDTLEEKGGVGEDIRAKMAEFGFDLFLKHPIAGVGFDNFRYHSPFKTYSHNDYIESLCSTGLFGFILYQLFSMVIIIRAIKLMNFSSIARNRFYLGMIVLSILVIKLIALGQILYLQPAAMIIIATLGSYTWILKNTYKNKDITF